MNFETKYLIRWGIPGWVFLLMSLWPFAIKELHIDSPLNSISIIFSTAVIGIVIGYLIYQIYFAWDWLLGLAWRDFGEESKPPEKWYHFHSYNSARKNNAELYYKLEFQWQNELSKNMEEGRRDYIAKRFSHLLSTTHSLGALFCSLLMSLIVNVAHFIYSIVYINTYNMSLIINMFIILFILIPSFANQKYYSRNVNEFRKQFLEEFKKNKSKNT
ncbi:hypothetical protein ACH95_21470 [Bacillus glycinifermentans]|uniref:Glycosyl-4,4'-diaponeurosporenoate acyltransferase n=1 Tax=Bacillus sonorensis TaxID=119858 RepID=A0ABN5ADK6_9BACI|nr:MULTISPECIES: hypothetical protein [Bacillus]ASB87345.1 hypothetical protein S101395_00791 [Bacillus sonorensis]KMM53320.1 hypothetical protein ACH95_21470 [Bacillus glycinifermentans]MBU8561506.1 hypothetical protein [Bacillus licheniformis]MDR4957967.1 hypothetical protein [Bacillus sonorensis]MEC0497369.1 hypothetical protein [Bacillus glycinifermentans]